jgi:hypothetical protein
VAALVILQEQEADLDLLAYSKSLSSSVRSMKRWATCYVPTVGPGSRIMIVRAETWSIKFIKVDWLGLGSELQPCILGPCVLT